MRDPNTLRVLSFDGGGTRGIASNKFMSLYLQRAGIDEDKIADNFDLISGTSVGAILALAYANRFTPTTMRNFFIDDAPYIFSISSLIPSLRPPTLSKVATMILGGSFYSNTILISRLEEEFGTITLTDMDTNVLVPSYQYDTDKLILFSNANFPGSFGQTALASQVALASAAPPIYFPNYIISPHSYIDGGVFLNNPSTLALTIGKMLKPTATRYCVLSVGTGMGDIGFEDNPIPPPPNPEDPPPPPFYANMYFLFRQIQIGIAGPQEAVARDLLIQNQFTLENTFTYRFQYNLDKERDTELDNTSTDFFNYMESSATQKFNDDVTNIDAFIEHITA